MDRPNAPSSTRRYRPASTKMVAQKISAAPFHPSRVRLVTNSERCPAAKPELLHAIVRAFGQRNRIVEAQRAERRCPDQTHAHGAADDIAAVVLQSQAGSGRYRTSRWRNTAGRIDLAGSDPGSRSLVIEQ